MKYTEVGLYEFETFVSAIEIILNKQIHKTASLLVYFLQLKNESVEAQVYFVYGIISLIIWRVSLDVRQIKVTEIKWLHKNLLISAGIQHGRKAAT